MLVAGLLGVPVPIVHDEFSYLLAADTFARGRLANPPLLPLISAHFESVHVIVQPTYMSKYPPAQGLLLALGQVLTGRAIVAVWLGGAALCASMTWMLAAWLPSRWALYGGLLTLIEFGFIGTWAQSFWGGALPAIGGALVYGGVRRVVDRPRVGPAVIMALGVLLLANSRPWEGLCVSLPAAALLLVWTVRTARRQIGAVAVKVVAPAVVVLGIGAVMMATYNTTVTGDATRMPYQTHVDQYVVAPLFLWGTPRAEPPSYSHERFEAMHVGYELRAYENQDTPAEFAYRLFRKAGSGAIEYLLPVLWLPLLALPWILRRPWMRFAFIGLLAMSVGLAVSTFFLPHYAAPGLALLYVLAIQGVRVLRVAWRRRGGRYVPLIVLLLMATHLGPALYWHHDYYADDNAWYRQRERMTRDLETLGGRHLVLVRYDPEYPSYREWVYNGADLDGAPVIWARELDATSNARLVEHFADRTAWLVYAHPHDQNWIVPYGED